MSLLHSYFVQLAYLLSWVELSWVSWMHFLYYWFAFNYFVCPKSKLFCCFSLVCKGKSHHVNFIFVLLLACKCWLVVVVILKDIHSQWNPLEFGVSLALKEILMSISLTKAWIWIWASVISRVFQLLIYFWTTNMITNQTNGLNEWNETFRT